MDNILNSSMAHISQATFCNRTLTELTIIDIIKIKLGEVCSLIARLNNSNSILLHNNHNRW